MGKLPTQEELAEFKAFYLKRKYYKYEHLIMLNELLLHRLKEKLPELEALLKRLSRDDTPYRFYHQSFKVYRAQDDVRDALELFRKIAGEDFTLNEWYLKITEDALAVGPHVLEHNDVWLEKTRPQMEAFFHTKYFVEWAVDSAKTLEEAPGLLPSGWAAVLYLFNVR